MNKIKPKFLIAAPSYSENSGGGLVLHQLCDLLNDHTEAFIVPMPRGSIINWLNLNSVERLIEEEKQQLVNFKTSPELNTPIYSGKVAQSDSVAVYPEVVFGNPFQFKNVARWVLYDSGFHRGMSCTSKGEIEFKFEKHFVGASIDGFSTCSGLRLNILMPKTIDYNELKNNVRRSLEDMHSCRVGTAFCVRKGKQHPHRLIDQSSICIDGRGLNEIREIFKKVKYFVSFDDETYFSHLASAYGCYSIISASNFKKNCLTRADQRMKKMPWLAYSEEQIKNSWENRVKLLEFFDNRVAESKSSVLEFFDFWVKRLNSEFVR